MAAKGKPTLERRLVEAIEQQNALLQRLVSLGELQRERAENMVFLPREYLKTSSVGPPATPVPIDVPAIPMPTPRMIGQPETISPDGVAVPGVVPGARTAGGTPLVTALQQAAANAAEQAVQQGDHAESRGTDSYAPGAAQRFLDEQVHKVVKQGRGDGKLNGQ